MVRLLLAIFAFFPELIRIVVSNMRHILLNCILIQYRYQVSLDGVQTLNFLRVVNMFVRNGDGFLRKMPLGEVSSLSSS